MLGVEIDDKLSWNKRIDKVAKKVASGIEALRKIRDFVHQQTLISVYHALINPHFDYCSEVWDTMGVSLSNRLQKLENGGARVIMNFSNDIPGPEAIKALGWEKLETRRTKSKAKTMYKILNKSAPSSLVKLFKYKNSHSTTSGAPLPRCNYHNQKLKS